MAQLILTEDQRLRDYYNLRARTYEEVYYKPERKNDVLLLQTEVMERLTDKVVLEVACGTGYWTQFLSQKASQITATDQSQKALDIAQAKMYPRMNVNFEIADAYNLKDIPGIFSAGFAGFWWSHIPKKMIHHFLTQFHSKLEKGAKVLIIDNHFVEGSNHPITDFDFDGNTYQTRSLPDGSIHKVLKNFPPHDEILNSISPFSAQIEIKYLKYFWVLEYCLNNVK
jgi:demethylmenaquinone methyltransferase/2-methoxy-6-polyprenyl-1,4-benzoquinol methylase